MGLQQRMTPCASLHRDPLLQFFEPVEGDVDLIASSQTGKGRGDWGKPHHEVFAVRADVEAGNSVYRQGCGVPKREAGLCLDIDGDNSVSLPVEKLLTIGRPNGAADRAIGYLILRPSRRKGLHVDWVAYQSDESGGSGYWRQIQAITSVDSVDSSQDSLLGRAFGGRNVFLSETRSRKVRARP